MGKKKSNNEDIVNKNEIQSFKQDINTHLINYKKQTAKNEKQKELQKAIKDKNSNIIIVNGPAGCGKTFMSLSESLSLLSNYSNTFTKLTLLKSVQELPGEDTGFKPGNTFEKLENNYMSFFQQLYKLMGKAGTQNMIGDEYIDCFPLGAIRGMSYDSSRVVILDEFQNIGIQNSKTILTRIEEGCKLICLGDKSQMDRRKSDGNALEFVTEKFKGLDDKIKIIEFDEEDILRNPLIKKITKVYQENNF